MSPSRIYVAVGVVLGRDGKVLITKRAPDAHQGGLWEFPGGKLESSETSRVALNRELQEELGIVVDMARPLIKFHHDYAECSVLLDVWLIIEWHGDISGCEDQEHKWVPVPDLKTIDFPAANQIIVTAIQLPSLYLICPTLMGNIKDYLEKIESCLKAGVQLLQF